MPSYRPKSLEELNNIYDKKLAAENAMKSGSSRISTQEKIDTRPPAYEPYTYDESKYQPEKTATVDDISDAVNDFIKSFGQVEEKKPVRVQQNVHPIQTTVKSTKIPSKKSDKVVSVQKKKNSAAKKQERTVLVRNGERSDLMDDYKKIMMDEDEESVSLKERLAMKKKSKAEKKESHKAAKKEKHEKAEKIEKQAEVTEEQQFREEKVSEAAAIEAEEVIIAAQQAVIEEVAENEQDQSYVPQHSFGYEEEAEEYADYEEAAEVPEQKEYEDYSEQEEYTQQYDDEAQEEYEEEYEQDQEQFESFADDQPEKRKGGVAKVISLLLLFVMLVLTAVTGAAKYVVCVDTGKAFMNSYYVFTAKERFLYSGISAGDLVISEERQINSGEAFVYYDNTSFRFAKPSDVVSASTDIIIAQNDNEQVIASSNNVRGAVIKVIPKVGRIVGLVMDNFLLVFGVMVGICLLLIIITAILFARGRKRDEEYLYTLDDEYYEDEPVYDEESLQEKDEELDNVELHYPQQEYEQISDEDVQQQQQSDMQIIYEISDDEVYDESYEEE